MTIKGQGGIFGRNPTFNDVTVDGTLTSASISVTALDNVAIGSTTPSTGDFTNVDAQDIDVRNQNSAAVVWVGEPDTSGLTTATNTSFLYLSGIVGSTSEYGGINFFRAHNNSRKIGASITHMRPATSLDDSDLIFKTSTSNAHATEKMRILHSGGITFNGDTSSDNALSDYEQGSWTPSFSAATGGELPNQSGREGTYTKIGDIVFARGKLFTSGLTSLSGYSGNVSITGLPYAVYEKSTGQVESTANAGSYGGLSGAIMPTSVRANGSVLEPTTFVSGQYLQLTTSNIDVSGGNRNYLMFAVTYKVS